MESVAQEWRYRTSGSEGPDFEAQVPNEIECVAQPASYVRHGSGWRSLAVRLIEVDSRGSFRLLRGLSACEQQGPQAQGEQEQD
jgi:hypothetical protein